LAAAGLPLPFGLKIMDRRLFIVEDTFLIAGRGLIAVPGIIPEGEERFRVGDPILLRRPDGSTLRWKIGGIEILHTPTPKPEIPILLLGLTKEDVPVGTAIWSLQKAEPKVAPDCGGIT